jgi:SAM-dependent methyltransferase
VSFSIDWLNLREPADSRARDSGLIARLTDWTAGRPVRVLDLGSGTGSSYRALAPALGGHWTLTDIDTALLAEARHRHGDEPTFAAVRHLDLVRDLEAVISEVRPDIICGSALIDLASSTWLDRLAGVLPRGTALYLALSYDGVEVWTPKPPHEGVAHAAFLDHQRTDKGFGPAIGPDAAQHLAEKLAGETHRVWLGDSPWILDGTERDLISALAAGSAEAVAQSGALTDAQLEDWAAGRAAADHVRIGHTDLLALPRD